MNKTKLLLIGAGGFGKEVLDIARNGIHPAYTYFAFIDDDKSKTLMRDSFAGVPLLGTRKVLQHLDPLQYDVCISIGNPKVRQTIAADVKTLGFSSATLIDASAIVRESVSLASGTIVCPHAIINTDARIGENVVINVGVLIGHDAVVNDFSVINPLATVLGAVTLGTGVLIGSSAAVHQLVRVGDWAKIAMGAIVYRNVPEYATVSGNPARIMSMDNPLETK